jgi:hypothetical protein
VRARQAPELRDRHADEQANREFRYLTLGQLTIEDVRSP